MKTIILILALALATATAQAKDYKALLQLVLSQNTSITTRLEIADGYARIANATDPDSPEHKAAMRRQFNLLRKISGIPADLITILRN